MTSVKLRGPRPGIASHFSKVSLAFHRPTGDGGRPGLFVFFRIRGRRQPPRGNAEALWQEWQRAPPEVTHLLNCLHYGEFGRKHHAISKAVKWAITRKRPRSDCQLFVYLPLPPTCRSLIVVKSGHWCSPGKYWEIGGRVLKAKTLLSIELLSEQS